MRTFKDTAGRTWEISLTIGVVNRIKSQLKLDLYAPQDPPGEDADERAKAVKYNGKPAPLVTVLNRDVSILFDVIFEIVRPQGEKLSLSAEDFVNGMGGDAAYDAYRAFQEEWEDFFQKFHRPDAAKMIEKHLEMVEAEATKDAKTVEKLAEMAEEAAERNRENAIKQADGLLRMSTSSPASSESTQSA